MKVLINILAVLGLVLIGALSFYWSDVVLLVQTSSTERVSIVDNICGQLWVSRAQNDPALLCYMNTRPERFCNADERLSFMARFNHYVHDRDAFAADMQGALVAISIQTGLNNTPQNNRSNDPLAALHQATASVGNTLKENGVAAAMKVDTVPRSQMVKSIHALALRGYFKAEDFGWWPDSLITRGFEGNSNVKSPCAAQQN
jgi:hypothetical protein